MKCTCFCRYHLLCMMWVLFFFTPGISFTVEAQRSKPKEAKAANKKVFYGLASFYSNKFNGRKTANGEIFSQSKMTCACNVVKLGTWLRVTNLRNGRSVIVKSNDRLHTKMKRVVDLTSAAAKKLGYTKAGLTRVKVEVLGRKRPAE